MKVNPTNNNTNVNVRYFLCKSCDCCHIERGITVNISNSSGSPRSPPSITHYTDPLCLQPSHSSAKVTHSNSQVSTCSSGHGKYYLWVWQLMCLSSRKCQKTGCFPFNISFSLTSTYCTSSLFRAPPNSSSVL